MIGVLLAALVAASAAGVVLLTHDSTDETTPPTTAFQVGGSYQVFEDTTLRSEPTTSAAAMGQVPKDARVSVNCKVKGENVPERGGKKDVFWHRVDDQGRAGYIPDSLLNVSFDKVPDCP